MVEYKLVKHCYACKKRFIVDKSKSRQYLCDECQKKAIKEE